MFVCYKIISVAAFGSAIRLRAKTLLNRIRILPHPNLTFFNNQSVVSKYRFSSLSDNKLSAHTYGRRNLYNYSIENWVWLGLELRLLMMHAATWPPAQKWIRISVCIFTLKMGSSIKKVHKRLPGRGLICVV